jgi:16S rRNA (adenine1518-N6/adenine1519-N6)-dimethyltransferase
MAQATRVADTIRAHGLRARRSLGQHFIHDPGILARIAAAAGPLGGATVLEVGPGPGGLTRALLDAGPARLIAIDKDGRAIRALADLAAVSGGRLTLVVGDALEARLDALATDGPLTIVGNLPYNVGTALLIGWLGQLGHVRSMTLMFQKEVALRLAAAPGTADYGRLAVIAQRLCTVERVFDLPPAAFVPPPKVHSSVVRLLPRADQPPDAIRRRLEQVTRAAFGQRRKMLRVSLRGLGADPQTLLDGLGIDPTRRAETLTIDEFCRIAAMLEPA